MKAKVISVPLVNIRFGIVKRGKRRNVSMQSHIITMRGKDRVLLLIWNLVTFPPEVQHPQVTSSFIHGASLMTYPSKHTAV
jgi:hypothetical protein